MESSFSHIALLVPSVDKSAEFLNSQDIDTDEPEIFESEGTKELYVGSYDEQKGLLLLLEAIAEGPYKRALKKRGPSLHHIAIDVLDIEEALDEAQEAGWQLHKASEQTMEHNTAWLFCQGVPTLIEVHQKKKLSSKPSQVSRLEIPTENMALFEALGLGDIVFEGKQLSLTVDGQKLAFAQIACL